MNFAISFLFLTIIFTVNSESTKDNSHIGSEKNVGNLKEGNSDKNDNGKKAYENKDERVSHHSVSNSNGKKYHDEDKSVDTHAKEIAAEIEEMPKEDQAVAYKIHAEWSMRAKGTETKLKFELEQSRNLYVETIILPLLRGEIEDLEKIYMPSIQLTKESMVKELGTSIPGFRIPEPMVKQYELSLHYVRWRYILKNCADKEDIKLIKEILMSVGLDDDSIAKCLAIFFEKASDRIHSALENLTMTEVKKGLIANGMKAKDIINSALTIFAVPRKKQEQLMVELIT